MHLPFNQQQPGRVVECDNQYPCLIYDDAALKKAIQQLDDLNKYPTPPGELSIVFVDDATIARIHGEFLKDPTPTDVITFQGDVDFEFAGEIMVSVDHADDNALQYGTLFEEELMLYIIHGYLHLSGLDDTDAVSAQVMRKAEQDCLNVLKMNGSMPLFKIGPKL